VARISPSAGLAPPSPALRRELGKWDLTAIGINQVIGSAVFALPGTLAASVGAWSPFLVAAVAVASMLIALCFAEVSSRFEGTGGSYLYTRMAFGRFAAFEVGWMMWFTRAASWASVINVLVAGVGFYLPGVTAGAPRAALISSIIGVVAIINILGIKLSAVVLNTFTIGKLIPLAVFILAGIFFIDPARLEPAGAVTMANLASTALLLIFAFGGYEVVPVPAGEAKDPRTAVPFALIMTIVIVAFITILVQVVALGVHPSLETSLKTPLAEAAGLFLGPFGAALLTAGVLVSTSGNNLGQALSGSRNLFALAEQGDLPRFFGYVHPKFRTPAAAIAVTAGVALVLGLSGTFVTLAAASAISRLLVYVATCASLLRLRDSRFAGALRPATFTVPLGPVIPAVAILISLTILAGATRLQLTAGAGALAAGAVLYLFAAKGQKQQ
jgi:basic amino acid/polyamine antiporter, APA family